MENFAIVNRITTIIVEEFATIEEAKKWLDGYQTPWEVKIVDANTGETVVA